MGLWWWVVGVVVEGMGVPLVLFSVPLMHACIFCQFGEKLDSG